MVVSFVLRRERREQGDLALVVTEGFGELLAVERADAASVATARDTWPAEDCRRIPLVDGRTLYLIHADLPARADAQRIRELERNAFLGSLFRDVGRQAGPGGVPWPLWALLFLLAVRLVIKGA